MIVIFDSREVHIVGANEKLFVLIKVGLQRLPLISIRHAERQAISIIEDRRTVTQSTALLLSTIRILVVREHLLHVMVTLSVLRLLVFR